MLLVSAAVRNVDSIKVAGSSHGTPAQKVRADQDGIKPLANSTLVERTAGRSAGERKNQTLAVAVSATSGPSVARTEASAGMVAPSLSGEVMEQKRATLPAGAPTNMANATNMSNATLSLGTTIAEQGRSMPNATLAVSAPMPMTLNSTKLHIDTRNTSSAKHSTLASSNSSAQAYEKVVEALPMAKLALAGDTSADAAPNPASKSSSASVLKAMNASVLNYKKKLVEKAVNGSVMSYKRALAEKAKRLYLTVINAATAHASGGTVT